MWRGQKLEPTRENCDRADLDYNGNPCPPTGANVQPLSDEDKRTIVRWIDLGCPIDLDFDPEKPNDRGYGWMLDDNRPTLTLTYPKAGENPPLKKIVIGMHDYYTGLDEQSLSIAADVPIDGIPAGQELAARFKPASDGVIEWKLSAPIQSLERGKLVVSIKDHQGNISRIERHFSIKKER
jgi:hypothetical protein